MSVLSTLEIIKRNGAIAPFDKQRIGQAIMNAYQAAGVDPEHGRYDEVIEAVLTEIAAVFHDHAPHVEQIQDLVEQQLVHFDQYAVSKHYILYREQQRQKRELDVQTRKWRAESGGLSVVKRDGSSQPFDPKKVLRAIDRHAREDKAVIDSARILEELPKNIFNGISTADLQRALILSAIAFIEHDSAYSYLAARLVLDVVYRESGRQKITDATFIQQYRRTFVDSLNEGIEADLFDKRLLEFDIRRLAGDIATAARPAVQLPRHTDALRTLLCKARQAGYRESANILDAGGDGSCDIRKE